MNEKTSVKKQTAWEYFKRYYPLYLMLLIPMAYIILFKYVPMYGIQIAFKKYNIFKGMGASPWVGFQWFKEAFGAKEFWAAVKNTFILNLGQQIICWPIPIILAILLTEISGSHGKLKEFTQTVLYIPHFMSTVIIAGIMYQLFGATGAFNNAIAALGFEKVAFLTNNWSWRGIYWFSGIWAGTGYGMIAYLAAIAGVNTELYDAAYMDGAGRWKRIWHVTLPQIKPTIVTILVMDIGKILNIGFEKPYNMSNVMVKEASSVISTYVYSVGLQAGRYDYATAVGLFQSLIAVVMVVGANWIARKLGEEGIM